MIAGDDTELPRRRDDAGVGAGARDGSAGGAAQGGHAARRGDGGRAGGATPPATPPARLHWLPRPAQPRQQPRQPHAHQQRYCS